MTAKRLPSPICRALSSSDGGQLAGGPHQTIVARLPRQRPEVRQQRIAILRLDETHRQRLAVFQPDNIGVTAEVAQDKAMIGFGQHGVLHRLSCEKKKRV